MGRQSQSSLENSVTLVTKLLWVLALCVACSLPYFLLTRFSIDQDKFASAEETPPFEFEASQLFTQMQPENLIEEERAPDSVVLRNALLNASGWVNETTKPKDTLGAVFKRVGLSMSTLQDILKNKQYKSYLSQIKPNQNIQFLLQKHQLQRMVLQIKGEKALAFSRQGKRFVAKIIKQKFPEPNANRVTAEAPQPPKNTPEKNTVEIREKYLTATVQYSLYSTAKRQKIPYKLIQQMIDILHWEINFAKDVRGGDRFSIVYKAKYVNGQMVSTGEILAVNYTNRGVLHSALRHVASNGSTDYFTPQGKSLRQAFSRYPIKFSRINSPFSLSRMHPILHYSRPHKGIDLAAPIGTPIRATGDGRIETLGYESGYGNVIKIVHHNKLYTSVYAHLQRFQKGVFRGGLVKRGQIIGYVGKSGLASGPHCHYEFHVNHRPKNPSTVALPHALPVPSRDLVAFKKHADKVVEHLKLFEEAHGSSKKYHAVG